MSVTLKSEVPGKFDGLCGTKLALVLCERFLNMSVSMLLHPKAVSGLFITGDMAVLPLHVAETRGILSWVVSDTGLVVTEDSGFRTCFAVEW